MYKKTLDVAITQIGVTELSGKNDGIPAERYMRGDKLPWCAGFILWCNEQSSDEKLAADVKSYYAMRSVDEFEKRLTERGYCIRDPAYVPFPNDIVFFKSRGSSDAGPGRHMGIVERVEVGAMHTVEGNVSNRVARRTHMSRADVSSFARIPRGAEAMPADFRSVEEALGHIEEARVSLDRATRLLEQS